MASTSSTEKDKAPTQSASMAGERRPSEPESSSQRQNSSGTSQTGYPARLQPGWETVHLFGGQGQQPINAAYMPGAQTVWPPGAVPFLQPQVYMYPGLPGNPPTFFPAGSLHPTQRQMPQMLPHLGMVVAGQQFPVNSMLPFNMTPAPTQEAWLQARNLRPQPGMVQGVRPTGWGGIPFQSSQQAQQHQRWQQSQRQEAANIASRRPERMQAQPPPPPPRASSTPQSAQMHKDLAPAGVLPPVSEILQAGRASSLPHLEQQQQQQQQHQQPPRLRQAEQQPQQQQPQDLASGQPMYPAAASAGSSGKVPCAFFLKTGTCAYGDKCKFEHPWDKLPVVRFNSMGLPLRQGQPECAYYLRHARCGFGPSCKFHHPEPGTSGSAQAPLEGSPDTDPANPSTSYMVTGIPATATAQGIPAPAAATGIPVHSSAADVPAVTEGTPALEPETHLNEASMPRDSTPAQTDDPPATNPLQEYASPPSASQSATASTMGAADAMPGMYVPMMPALPVNALPMAALQHPQMQMQVQMPVSSIQLQQAVFPGMLPGSANETLYEDVVPIERAQQVQQAQQAPQQTQQPQQLSQAQQAQHAQQVQQAQHIPHAQQAQQPQQAQQGVQHPAGTAVPTAAIPLQSWPQPASIAAGSTAMYAQAGSGPTVGVTSAQMPVQQVASTAPQQTPATAAAQQGASNGFLQPNPVQPGQTFMAMLPTAPASPQYTYTSQYPQTAQFASSAAMMQFPGGTMQATSVPATQFIQQVPMQQQLPLQQQLHVLQQVPMQQQQQQIPMQQQQQQPVLQHIPMQQQQVPMPMPMQGVPAGHTLVAANPSHAAFQPIPLVVSPAYQAIVPAGLGQPPTIAGEPLQAPPIPSPMTGLSPAASKDIGQPDLEELTAGLPALHLGTAKASNDAQHSLDAAPSVSTPLPSEASLATASTTSTLSSGKLSGDAAKAIETVRNSVEARGSAKADQKSGS